MNIFDSATLMARQAKAAQSLAGVLSDTDLVLVFSGEPIQKPGGHDQTYPFLPHPDYFWLTGSRREHGVSAFTKKEGWQHFMKLVSRDERIWEGGREKVEGLDINGLDAWIEKLKPARVFSLGQLSKAHAQKPANEDELNEVQEAFNRVRRIKDAAEVALVRSLAAMANHGYLRLKDYIKPGVSERQIELQYEGAVFAAGADKMPYGSIVGTGTNGAILHAVPTGRIVKSGDLVLVDAGADVADYCVDITRVFPADGVMNERQRTIYDLVLKAQTASIALCKPGVEWHDVHKASARVFAEGLKGLGIIKGSTEDALEAGAVSVFFPHGVGHMVGLRVRDVGGRAVKDPRKAFGVRVRVDMPLEAGFLMTVEPGLYFIEALMKDSETRQKFADFIDFNEADKWSDFGGVRLEDDILVTQTNPDNLTAVVAK